MLMVLLGLPPQFVEPRSVLPGSSHGGSEEQGVTETARVHLQPLLGFSADCYGPLSRAGTRQSQEQEETPGWAGLGVGGGGVGIDGDGVRLWNPGWRTTVRN